MIASRCSLVANGLAMVSDFVFHKLCNIGSVMACFFERLEINLQKSVFLFGS
jgi:hypothetical protein